MEVHMTGNDAAARKAARLEERLAVDAASTRSTDGNLLNAEVTALDEAHQLALERQVAKARTEPGNSQETLDSGETVSARRDGNDIHWSIHGPENSYEIARGVISMNRQRRRGR
jgi:hypothetical protein